ncbi:MAG: hypothetical protein KAF27_07785 [Porphyrobacter sp.]|nr:hypothetical protein [Porphyrobacter sp.]
MTIANHDARTRERNPHTSASLREEAPSLRLVDHRLALFVPDDMPGAAWEGALMPLASWLNVGIQCVAQDRSAGLRQRVKWPWASNTAPDGPIFAPWLPHSALAFQDPRGVRDLFPARWVASYLWDPCGTRPRSGGLDVMLISPHPAACRHDEEAAAALAPARLLQDMIGAAHAEGRNRIAIIGYERSRSMTARQLLAAKPALPGGALDLEVLAIETALARLAANPGSWDAIIVLPELRSLVFTLLAELTGIGGAWPMVWHRQGLALLCSETAGPAPANVPLDAALLVQGLALAMRDAGNGFAARRLVQGWARLRDRGVVSPTRGSPSPYATQICDAEIIDRLCKEPEDAGRAIALWKAIAAPPPAGPVRAPAQLVLVQDR